MATDLAIPPKESVTIKEHMHTKFFASQSQTNAQDYKPQMGQTLHMRVST